MLVCFKTLPKLSWRREFPQFGFKSRLIDDLDDACSAGRLGELQSKYFSVVFRLLESINCSCIRRLHFNDRGGKVGPIAKNVVYSFTVPTLRRDQDSTVGERHLFVDSIRFRFKGRRLKVWGEVFSTCTGLFRNGAASWRHV